jgi:hypothetical protein
MAYNIPVLLVSYFPVRGANIDTGRTGDVGGALVDVRGHTINTTSRVIEALEKGSTYHGYKDLAAQPSLHYEIVSSVEILESLPTWPKPGDRAPMTDYNAVMRRVDIRYWVEQRGVREVWIWGYHGGVVGLWESNMAGPYGDVSNSDCRLDDLPVLGKTYTVYHYNYGRTVSEAVEDHMHQIEALLRHVDRSLFWDQFVGGDKGRRCGWAHYPPNATKDYEWNNTAYALSDIETWKPDGGTRRKRLNCTRWHSDSLEWFIYWMQNLPGADNGLTFEGRPLTNWWMFVGDFDGAMAQGRGLAG